MDGDPFCVICGNSLSVSEAVIVTKGLQTLINTSVTRGDGIHTKFSDSTSVTVHKQCRKSYTRPSSILKSLSHQDDKVSENRTSSRSEDSGFDFKNHCLFCGKLALVETKRELKYRKVVHNIETLETLEHIKKRAEQRQDSEGKTVLTRINCVIDLVAVEARYHETCYAAFLTNPSTGKAGRPENENKRSVFDKLCEYIDEEDESQYSLQELFTKLREFSLDGEDVYCYSQIKRLLSKKYGDRLNTVEGSGSSGKETVFTFKDSSKKLLHQAWYEKREKNELEERKRIVLMAAKIIREDIQTQVFDNESYPQPENIFKDLYSPIPETLKLLIEEVTKPKRKKDKVKRKQTMICHSIISITRPKTFISPLLLSCGVYCLRHFASRRLVDILHSLGASASYSEVRRFEFSCMTVVPSQTVSHFTQWVFDNADFNIRTLDGHNTFHSMGGIRISTPPEETFTNSRVLRLKTPSAETVAAIANNEILNYPTTYRCGLSGVVVKTIPPNKQDVTNLEMAKFSNNLWICMHLVKNTPEPLWNGFMNAIFKNGCTIQNDTSSIVPVPFFNHPASNINTIYSTLVYAAEECKKLGQKTCIVTYDQPLFWKAMHIVTAAEPGTDLSKIVVRLGGFHLLMSYLGTIGYIMSGSGIEELWGLLYSKNTVGKMMSGHAYSKALRDHFLTFLILHVKLLEHSVQEIKEETKSNIRHYIHELMTTNKSIEDLQDNFSIKQLIDIIETTAEKGIFSRTAKLWLQYIEQIKHIFLYLQADRVGDWKLHLYCIKSMMPYFHAAGHIFYAKCAHLYVQQMEELKKKMDATEFKKFTEDYFTIRKKNRVWSGVAPDMVIEQSLMKSMKVSGGVTQGRGMTDSTLSRWVSSCPMNIKVAEVLEDFCEKRFVSSDQHIEFRPSRQSRDDSDLGKLFNWIILHNPFNDSCPKDLLFNIASGLVADDKTNCDNAKYVGEKLQTSIAGGFFGEIKLERKKRVMPISATKNSLIIRNESVVFNPLQLFTRIAAVLKSNDNLREHLKYELATQPPSLFDEVSMRKNVKSTLATIIESAEPCVKPPSIYSTIVDGGFLMHALVWGESDTYRDICFKYVRFVQKHFSPCEAVVFDGYTCALSTKSVERQRRIMSKMSATIAFDENMVATTKQANFLRNSENKSRLIKMMMGYFQAEGITVIQADEDADTLICSTAINVCQTNSTPVAVIGSDTDLLTILIARGIPGTPLYFLRPQTTKLQEKCYSITKIQESIGPIKNVLLFLHAATGCDTTSAIFRMGKSKAFKLVKQDTELRSLISQFNSPQLDSQRVTEIGEIFLKHLYGGKQISSLDDLRYIRYNKEVTKTLSSKFNLATLPPTSAAAAQHSLRVYLQVQQWLGNNLDPTEWGWFVKEGRLNPVPSKLPAASDEILLLISCDCKITATRDCDARCQCKKADLHCTKFCSSCLGETCKNSALVTSGFEDDDYDDVV